MKKPIVVLAALALVAGAALILFRLPASPPIEAPREFVGSNGPWSVTVQVEEQGQLVADEPLFLVLDIRNSSERAIRIDPISLQSSSLEMEVTRPSGARDVLRSGLGLFLRGDTGVEIPAGAAVHYHEGFLPDETGDWTASLSVRITPQDLRRETTVVKLPTLRFHVGPQNPSATAAIRSERLDRLLLGQEKFLDPEIDGPKLGRLEAAASVRLKRHLALARGMTLALSHRFGYRKEDQDAIRLLEDYVALQPRAPLTEAALLGLAKIYSQSRPFQETAGDADRDAREFRRVADRLRGDHPSCSLTLGELTLYEQ